MTKKIKKIISTSLASFLSLGLLTLVITTSVINSGTNTSNLFAEIVVSDNTSVLADKSFSETTFNGYRDFLKNRGNNELDKPAKDFREGFGLWRRPGNNNLEKESTFKGIFENGKELIIAPGFNHANAIENLSQDPAYANKGFLLLDSGLNKDASNVSTVLFRMEQAGFQSGVAASQFLSSNEQLFKKDDGKLKIGGFVGLPFPSTLDFLVGFQKGMVSWNQVNPSKTQIEWVTLGNNANAYASGSFGIGDGRQISKDLLNGGADVIMPIAGTQTLDTITEIRLQSRPVIIVGVDSAQENNDSLKHPIPGLGSSKIQKSDGTTVSDNQNIIQFSAEKKLDIAVQGTLGAISNPDGSNKINFSGSDYGGFGYTNIIALGSSGDGAVGISRAGQEYFSSGLGQDPVTGFQAAVSGLLTNPSFQEMIGTPTESNSIKLHNTSNGRPSSNSEVSGVSISRYEHGLSNLIVSIAPIGPNGEPIRLVGNSWAPPLINPNPPFLALNQITNLRKKVL